VKLGSKVVERVKLAEGERKENGKVCVKRQILMAVESWMQFND
jgi:hypothetical protein